MKKDYIITFITEFIVLVSGILVYKFAADILGKEGFSEYALTRRTISLIHPALLMGLGVGIPRYIAYTSANANPKNSDAYFTAGTSTLIMVALTFTFILNLLKDKFAFLIFGSSNYNHLMFPISLMLFGIVLHAACYSYFRGRLLMLRANSLQFINMGMIPLFVFMMGKNVHQVLLISGLLWITISIIYLIFIAKNLTFKGINFFNHTKELLSYGLQRVPGDFGMAALLALPAFFTAHIAGVKEAGFVAFGISLLGIVGSAFAPIGIIFLPKASQIVASKDIGLLKNYVNKILKTTVSFTAIGTIIFLVFADKIINLYLGEGFSDIVLIARIIMIASIAYTVYISMRSVIDAYYVKAVNTINIMISLLLFLSLSALTTLFGWGYINILVTFIVSIFILGFLTLLETRKLVIKSSAI